MVGALPTRPRRPDVDARRRHVDMVAPAGVAIALQILVDGSHSEHRRIGGRIAGRRRRPLVARSRHQQHLPGRQALNGRFDKRVRWPCKAHVDDVDAFAFEPIERLDDAGRIAGRLTVLVGIEDIGEVVFR